MKIERFSLIKENTKCFNNGRRFRVIFPSESRLAVPEKSSGGPPLFLDFLTATEFEHSFHLPPAAAILKSQRATLAVLITRRPPTRSQPHTDKTKTDIQVNVCFRWVQGPDLNRRPPGYEPDELPSCSTLRYLVMLVGAGDRNRTGTGN